jgi:hypothetical protein
MACFQLKLGRDIHLLEIDLKRGKRLSWLGVYRCHKPLVKRLERRCLKSMPGKYPVMSQVGWAFFMRGTA